MKMRSALISGTIGILGISIGIAFLGSISGDHENKLRVAYFPNIGHAIPIVGLQNEIFSESLGNKTLIEKKLFDSGPQVVEALFSNSIDIAYVGPGPAINGFLKSENQNIKILAGAASGGASFIVHPNSEINSVEDFSGKRIAAPQIGNTQDVSLRHYLTENGLRPVEKGGSVTVFNVQNPDIYTLFTKGDIDGAWVPEPWATMLVQDLGGNRLFFEEELWPEKKFASVLLIARTDYVEHNPQVIQNWLESHEDVVTWINEHPKETVIVFNQFMEDTLGKSLPESIVRESLSNIEITSDPINDSIQTFAQRADSLGYFGRSGYSLDGIFYEKSSNFQNLEVNVKNE